MWNYKDFIFGELPCIVTFVSVEVDGKQNTMTASGMFVSDAPPLIAISVSKQSMTHRLIAKAKELLRLAKERGRNRVVAFKEPPQCP